MHGFLDELDQAFFTFQLGGLPLDFQIDTGFSGTLIVGEELFRPNLRYSRGHDAGRIG